MLLRFLYVIFYDSYVPFHSCGYYGPPGNQRFPAFLHQLARNRSLGNYPSDKSVTGKCIAWQNDLHWNMCRYFTLSIHKNRYSLIQSPKCYPNINCSTRKLVKEFWLCLWELWHSVINSTHNTKFFREFFQRGGMLGKKTIFYNSISSLYHHKTVRIYMKTNLPKVSYFLCITYVLITECHNSHRHSLVNTIYVMPH